MTRRDLLGKNVAIHGYGREGRASLRALREISPTLTVVNDTPLRPEDRAALAEFPGVNIQEGPCDWSVFDVVIKSPGISRYRPDLLAAEAAGVLVTSATRLWLAEHQAALTVAITGTKGKSTTASLLAHVLNQCGLRANLGGNIGQPLFDLPETPPPEAWVLELSSYQTSDLDQPVSHGLVLNLFPEHLDWHGGVDTYFRDKLRLAEVARTRWGNATDSRLAQRLNATGWFNQSTGWHAQPDGLYHGEDCQLRPDQWRLPGQHNLSNLAAVITVAEHLGLSPEESLQAAKSFRGLPHRLFFLGEKNGLRFVDDSISTTPQSTQAALAAFAGQKIILIAGGQDRGLDWQDLVAYLANHPLVALITLGESGPRVATTLAQVVQTTGGTLAQVGDLEQAVARARQLTPPGGLVLLSPGAPSYDQFRDFQHRGQVFATAAGFG